MTIWRVSLAFVRRLERVEQGSVDGSGSVDGNDDAADSAGVQVHRGHDHDRAVRGQRELASDLTAGELGDPGELIAADDQKCGLP